MKTKKNEKQMTRTEIKEAVKKVLPKGWRLSGIWMKDSAFVVQCPLDTYFGGGKAYKGVIRTIEKATNSECCGGGCLIGSGKYDNEFFWD